MKVACVQFRSTDDPWLNLLRVNDFVVEASAQGCELVCFPENVFYRGPKKSAGFSREDLYLSLDAEARLVPSSAFSCALAQFAESWKIHVSLGSVLERASEAKTLPFNSHWVVQPSGQIAAYRKIHLFDYDSNDERKYRESTEVQPGYESVSVGLGTHRVGLAICYDLRFPELFRLLTLKHGTSALLLPAAFTHETGLAHWHVMLRSRAVENLSYVIASGQWGTHVDSSGHTLKCFGHSLVVDPWGRIVAEASGEGDELLVVDLDWESMLQRRSQLPALQSARLFQEISFDSST